MRAALLAVPLAIALAACGADPDHAAGEPHADAAPAETASAAPVDAREEDGVQVADIAVDGAVYVPAAVRLRAGVPARLVFTRNDRPTCADTIKAPALGIPPTALPVGVPTAVAFTPAEAGDYTFTCAMDMISGQIVVGP